MRLNNAVGVFTSVYQDWSELLVNPNYVRRGNEISWKNRRAINLQHDLTNEDIALLSDENQFSFQFVEDGSIVQLYYLYSDLGLKTARLAYYNSGQSNPQTDPHIHWIRIDYDPSGALGVSHATCHMHMSSLPSARLVVNNIPTPRQFIEFIISSFYPDIFFEKRLDVQGMYSIQADLVRVNSDCFEHNDLATSRIFPHLSFPGVVNH